MPESTPRVAAADLTAFCQAVFAAMGLSPDDARVQTEVLIWANLRGIDSHGVMRLPRYVEWLSAGTMCANAMPRVVKDSGATAIIDGERAVGAVAMSFAMQDAMRRARTHSIGWSVLRRATHAGAVGYYAAMAAAEGMAGLAVATSRPNMAYFGARAAGVATTPIAIAVPGGPDGMLLLDMSTSELPIGKIRAARATGQRLPRVMALTEQGEPTDDPHEAAIPLPLGGPKGSGLSLMFECLTGVLTGHPLLEPALTGKERGHAQNGLAVAVDIAAFSSTVDFEASIRALARSIKGLPAMNGGDEVLLPGEPEARESQRRLREGVPIPGRVWDELAETAQRCGVTLPSTLQ